MASKAKGIQARQMPNTTSRRQLCRYCHRIHAPWQCSAYGKMCTGCRKMGHYKKVCRSKRDHMVHELEVEMVQVEEIETVSINSVHLNKNQSVIMAYLDTYAGENNVEILYKINMGSEGNIMPLYIFKKLFKNITVEQLKKSIKNYIKLCTYNRTSIMQLGTCAVFIKFKNIRKFCEQALIWDAWCNIPLYC